MIWPLLISPALSLATALPRSIFSCSKWTLFFVVFVGFHFCLFFLTFLCTFCLFGRNMHISFTCLTAISNFSSDIHLFRDALLNHKIRIRYIVRVFTFSITSLINCIVIVQFLVLMVNYKYCEGRGCLLNHILIV